jgi:hypothetical protein
MGKNNLKILLIIFLGLCNAFFAQVVLAASTPKEICTISSPIEHCLEIPLPIIGDKVSGIASYLVGAYDLAVGIAVILAAIMIVIGGIEWMTSADNPGRIKEAKGRIFGAITGLAILLASFLLLNLVGGENLTNLGKLQDKILGKFDEVAINVPSPSIVNEDIKGCVKDRASCVKEAKNWIGSSEYTKCMKMCDNNYIECLTKYGYHATPTPIPSPTLTPTPTPIAP